MDERYVNTADELFKELEKLVDEEFGEANLIRQSITKNNGKVLEGVCLRLPGKNVSPQIYMDDAIERIIEGNSSIDDEVTRMMISLERAVKEAPTITLSDINLENAKRNIKAVVINAEKNKNLLEECPHELIGDMAIVPRYYISAEASFLVKNEHCGAIGLEPTEVMEYAKRNVCREKYSISTMADTIRELIGDMPDEIIAEMAANVPPIFVVTNDSKVHGATGLFINKNLRAAVREKVGEDYWVIPSSIHEVICIGKSACSDPEDLAAMIQAVNMEQVAVAEQLGDMPEFVDEALKITPMNKLTEAIEKTASKEITMGLHK